MYFINGKMIKQLTRELSVLFDSEMCATIEGEQLFTISHTCHYNKDKAEEGGVADRTEEQTD